MKPSDPRVRGQLAPARRPLTGMTAGAVAGGLLVVGQAFAVAGLVVAVVRDQPLLPWAVAVGLVLVGRAATGLVVDVMAARAAAVVGRSMRDRVVDAACAVPPQAGAGELATLATRGVTAAEPYLTRYLPALLLAGILPPLTVVALATQDLLSAVIVLATLPLVPVFGALVGLATRDRAQAQWRALSSLSGHFVDVVRGLPTLVAYRRARAQSERIRDISDRHRRATLDTLRIAFASSAVLELVATLSVALVAVTVGVRLAHGDLGLQTALTTLLLAPEAYWPLRRVGAEFHASAEGIAAFEQVASLPAPVAAPAPVDDEGELALDAVTVGYPGREQPVLEAVSARFAPRGITAVVGPSGCGKSTLLLALAGLLPVDRGQVRLGGRPLAPSERPSVTWLPQRPGFVAGTVADNLRAAVPEASDDRLIDALARVALDLPDGLATEVGEDGTLLSAGQRARLALARAFVADRPWVLLDEPTAHLDEETERVVADALVDLSRRAGVVVVAHRPALVALADHVVRLDAPAAPDVPDPTPEARSPETSPARDVTVGLPVAPERRAPFLVPTLLGAAASASGVALTATAGWLIVQASTRPAVLTLLVAVVGVRAFGLARPVLRYAERLRAHDAALRRLVERRVELYDALVPLAPGRLGRRRGDLLASLVDDVDCVVDRELRERLPVRGALLVGLLATAVAGWWEPRAGLVVAGFLLVAGPVGHAVARAGGRAREDRALAARALLADRVVEASRLAPELAVWRSRETAASRALVPARVLEQCARRGAARLAAGRAVVLAATGVALAVMAYAVSGASAVSGPVAALLVLLPLACAEVLVPAVEAGASAPRTAAAARRLAAVATWTPPVSDPTTPVPVPEQHGLRGRGLAASWDGRPVFADLDLDLRPGERVGVVGPSGCGKSTLAALLLRFTDPVAGELELAAVPLRALALDDVRGTVGLVDDDPHVFATTLAENVRFARPGADDLAVEQALRAAALGPWLDGLPDGLGTWLGEGHGDVSGGERARLALARALLADPPVLVLDEPTAHLDHATAAAVARDLLTAAGGRSVVWITHGTEALEHVDRVLEMSG